MKKEGPSQEYFRRASDLQYSNPLLAALLYWLTIEINPDYEDAWVNMGKMLYEDGELSAAQKCFELALNIDPQYALAHFNLGSTCDELENYCSAIAEYAAAIKIAPDYADAHFNLANTYRKSGAHRKSIRHWLIYERLDKSGLWHDKAVKQRQEITSQEKLFIVHRNSNRTVAT